MSRAYRLIGFVLSMTVGAAAVPLLNVRGSAYVNGTYITLYNDYSAAASLSNSAGASGSQGESGSSAALASWGSLGVSASGNATQAANGSGSAVASFSDVWTIQGLPQGTPGTLQLGLSMTGSYSYGDGGLGLQLSNGYADDIGTVLLAVYCSSGLNPPCVYNPNPSFSVATTETLSFHYGVPFVVQLRLEGDAGATNGPSSNSVDAMHTAQFTGLQVFDQGGNAFSGYTLTADSGHVYLFNQDQTVPEPGTAAAPVAAVILLALGKRLGRRKPRPSTV